MADLVLSEEHKQYQDLARDFSRNEIARLAHNLDQTAQFPLELMKKAWEVGLFNVRAAAELGGLGLATWDACVMAEEIGAACIGAGSVIWANDLAVAMLIGGGSDEQKSKWLQPLLDKFAIAGHCLSDTAGGYGVKYKRVGEQFKLNGDVVSINAGHATWVCLDARDEQDKEVSTTFIIPAGISGFEPGTSLPRLGMRSADVRITSFRDVTLSGEHVVGTVGGGSLVSSRARAAMAPVIASYLTGLMRAACENSVRYSKERRTMGQPIGNHQAVAFMLADLAKDAESSRLMAWKSAWMNDHDHPNLQLSESALTFACDAAMRGTTDAVQIYGGYGYTKEYPVEKLMRDAKTMQVLVGAGTQKRLQQGLHVMAGTARGAW